MKMVGAVAGLVVTLGVVGAVLYAGHEQASQYGPTHAYDLSAPARSTGAPAPLDPGTAPVASTAPAPVATTVPAVPVPSSAAASPARPAAGQPVVTFQSVQPAAPVDYRAGRTTVVDPRPGNAADYQQCLDDAKVFDQGPQFTYDAAIARCEYFYAK